MLFGKRDKKKEPNERVLNLKARVDALRQADEASRGKLREPISLDHFLEGDDVLTGREIEDSYIQADSEVDELPSDASEPGYAHHEVDLEAELQRYLKRQEELALQAKDSAPPPPVRRREPENTSLLLDGTWSRDDEPGEASRRPLLESSERDHSQWGTAPSKDLPAPESESDWPEDADTAWPDSRQWPPEEDWPPDQKAV